MMIYGVMMRHRTLIHSHTPPCPCLIIKVRSINLGASLVSCAVSDCETSVKRRKRRASRSVCVCSWYFCKGPSTTLILEVEESSFWSSKPRLPSIHHQSTKRPTIYCKRFIPQLSFWALCATSALINTSPSSLCLLFSAFLFTADQSKRVSLSAITGLVCHETNRRERSPRTAWEVGWRWRGAKAGARCPSSLRQKTDGVPVSGTGDDDQSFLLVSSSLGVSTS